MIIDPYYFTYLMSAKQICCYTRSACLQTCGMWHVACFIPHPTNKKSSGCSRHPFTLQRAVVVQRLVDFFKYIKIIWRHKCDFQKYQIVTNFFKSVQVLIKAKGALNQHDNQSNEFRIFK